MVELDDLDEIKLLALDHLVAKNKMERIYKKRVWLKSFKVGNLCGKWSFLLATKIISLENGLLIGRSFIISKVLVGVAYYLADKDGILHERSINGKYLKAYKLYV